MKKIVLVILVLFAMYGCMKIQFGQGAKMEIHTGNQSPVSVGNKDVPIRTQVMPVIPSGL